MRFSGLFLYWGKYLRMAKSASVKTVKKTVAKKAVVKTAVKKNASKNSNTKEEKFKIKYEDKSGGQPQLLPIFENLKKLFLPYIKGDMKLHGGHGGKATLINERPLVIDGRKKPGMWFVSALIQKGYVGFYYMPVYMNEPVRKQLHPDLLKCLKGKACFYIKKDDPEIYAHIKVALKIGFDDYHKRGWL